MTERAIDGDERTARTAVEEQPPIDESNAEPIQTGETAPAAEGGAALDPAVAPPVPGAPSIAPDGGRFVFQQADENGRLRIWSQSLTGDEAAAIVANDVDLLPMETGPQWSPDGAFLAVAGKHPDDGRSTIFIVSAADGATRQLIEHAAADHSPAWSPDGTAIAFISGRDGRDSLAAISSDGFGPSLQLSAALPGLDDHHPAWSTNGKRIAFARKAVEGELNGDHIWAVTLETGEIKQVTKRLAARRSLVWAPDRELIMHVAEDGDWENIAVVNPDNTAGWNIASEYGDKSDPHWTHDGQRVIYIRRKDGVSRACERGTSSSNNESLDPGAGVVHHTRFLPDKRVLYCYAPATGAARWIIQEAKVDAERTELPGPISWTAKRTFIQPSHAEYDVNGKKIGALAYRLSEQAGSAPAVLLLGDRVETPVVEEFSIMAQALAASGLTVITPSMPGTPGYGKRVAGGLKDAAAESEASDLVGLIDAVKALDGVDKDRLAVVGVGYGGALALQLAGARVGSVQAVAVIDPISDWNIEFDHTDAVRRTWLIKNFGLPAVSFAAYASRTPVTWIGVIEAPLLLIGTDQAPAGRAEQLDILAADLAALNVAHERESAAGETEWSIGQRAAAFIRETLIAVVPPADPRVDHALAADSI